MSAIQKLMLAAFLSEAYALPTMDAAHELAPTATVKAQQDSPDAGKWFSIQTGTGAATATCPYNEGNRGKSICSSERFQFFPTMKGLGSVVVGGDTVQVGHVDPDGPQRYLVCKPDGKCRLDADKSLASPVTIFTTSGTVDSGDMIYIRIGAQYLSCQQGPCTMASYPAPFTIYNTANAGPVKGGMDVYIRSGLPSLVSSYPGTTVGSGVAVYFLGGTAGQDRWMSCGRGDRCDSRTTCPYDEIDRIVGKCNTEKFTLVKPTGTGVINNGDEVFLGYGNQWMECCGDSCKPGDSRTAFTVYNSDNTGPIRTGGHVYFESTGTEKFLGCYWGHCDTKADCPKHPENRLETSPYCQGERFTLVLAGPPDTGNK